MYYLYLISALLYHTHYTDFIKEVQSLRQRYPHFPVAAHCSAGVGRSGVLVLVDMLTTSYDAGEVR